MMEYISSLERKVLSGQEICFEDALKLMETKEKEVTEELCKAADRIREHFCGREADLCTIMNAKSGSCSEDCKY